MWCGCGERLGGGAARGKMGCGVGVVRGLGEVLHVARWGVV